MILCSGAFDGLHAGHVRYLEEARMLCEEGELLHCAVAPDAYIEKNKGRAPAWSQADRVATVCALRLVGHVWLQHLPTPAGLIRVLKPRLFVKGADWCGRMPAEVIEACADVGCDIRFVDAPGRHVSETITASA